MAVCDRTMAVGLEMRELYGNDAACGGICKAAQFLYT